MDRDHVGMPVQAADRLALRTELVARPAVGERNPEDLRGDEPVEVRLAGEVDVGEPAPAEGERSVSPGRAGISCITSGEGNRQVDLEVVCAVD